MAPEVYESYLKGRFISSRGKSRADIEQGLGYFSDSIKQDPTFAPAYVGLANSYSALGTIFGGAPPAETRPKVMSAARRALELDPSLAEAHVLLGNVLQEEWQWGEAGSEYKRALELAPNSATAHAGYSLWLLCQGRADEAVDWMERARELDPVAVSGVSVAWILFLSRRYDDALREDRSVVAIQPDAASALWDIGFGLIAKGQPKEAIPVLEKALAVSNRSSGVMGVLIRAYARSGRRADALRLLAELQERRKKGYVPAGAFVNAYLGLDDKENPNILQFLKVHPYFDPLRSDPRFADLVRRVGLS